MPAQPVRLYETENEQDVKFRLQEQTGPEEATFRVWATDDEDGQKVKREWEVEVSSSGYSVTESWRDGTPVALGKPEWLENWTSMIRRQR